MKPFLLYTYSSDKLRTKLIIKLNIMPALLFHFDCRSHSVEKDQAKLKVLNQTKVISSTMPSIEIVLIVMNFINFWHLALFASFLYLEEILKIRPT